ncbi:MAG: hypothetical protein PUP90_32155 [Nostoc sp. S4]|nr:hypothetical protein [Nostoc sp. S4]
MELALIFVVERIMVLTRDLSLNAPDKNDNRYEREFVTADRSVTAIAFIYTT